MKPVYYIQIEDKNVDEGHNTSTLAGLKSNLDDKIQTLVLSNHGQDLKDKYSKSSVDTVIYDNEKFGLTDFDDIIAAVKKFLSTKEDYLVVLDDSNLGNSLASRIAAAMNIPFVSHVEELKASPNSYTVSRHIAGSKAIRETPLKSAAAVTVSFNGILDESGKAKTKIVKWELSSRDEYAYIPNENSGNDLAYAKVVVAGGKGLQDADGFKPLEELADKLDASVAATKAVTDQGWVDKSKMVGISNLTISPDVYYAFGIAGAVQHTAGMDKSKHIIAVNTDKSAPIFKLAQYGIIGDANKVIDQLINLL